MQTIQGVVEKTIKNVFNQEVKVFAADRTDAGVNALGQVIHSDLEIKIAPKQIKDALNKALPYDIRINKISVAIKSFNARFDACNKTYVYFINTSSTTDAVSPSHIYQYNRPINISKIRKGSKLLEGKHNFLSFSTDERSGESLQREVQSIKIKQDKNLVSIAVKGSGFLRSQVKLMVGSLLALNEDKITLNKIKQLLNNPKKGQAIYKAPACGLCLVKVGYKK
ncbi:MAG: tRNA pseudouridine(38-40) synthase TruA [Mycoplasmoidaceae bacterium]|nr:tRNA pseudouridine(38-40) synthase TruA [Mycoplasmoidaceae bacterium]